jgi:hypothetical protein
MFIYFFFLCKAERDYEKRKAKKELAKLNGEDKWMLPELDAQLSGKSKKSKKEKKHKKDKKNKKSKKKDDSSDSDEWVEKTSEVAESISSAPLQRDEWMSVPSLLPIFSKSSMPHVKRTSLNKDEEIARKIMMEKPGQTSRELNPYWKNGGTGLPPEKREEESSKSHETPNDHEGSRSCSDGKKQRTSDRDVTLVNSRSRNRSRSRSRERKHPEKIRKPSTVQERFRRPSESDEVVSQTSKRFSSSQPGWKKNEAKSRPPMDSLASSSTESEEENYKTQQPTQEEEKMWTEQELNALGAKIIKAEIMGQTVVVCFVLPI